MLLTKCEKVTEKGLPLLLLNIHLPEGKIQENRDENCF